jgi:hypothetical protein
MSLHRTSTYFKALIKLRLVVVHLTVNIRPTSEAFRSMSVDVTGYGLVDNSTECRNVCKAIVPRYQICLEHDGHQFEHRGTRIILMFCDVHH